MGRKRAVFQGDQVTLEDEDDGTAAPEAAAPAEPAQAEAEALSEAAPVDDAPRAGCSLVAHDAVFHGGSVLTRLAWDDPTLWVGFTKAFGSYAFAVPARSPMWFPTAEDLAATDWVVVRS